MEPIGIGFLPVSSSNPGPICLGMLAKRERFWPSGAEAIPAFEAGEESIQFRAEAMPDHRLRYLIFEGDIGGGRGQVRQVGAGMCRIEAATESTQRIRFLS